MEGDSLERARSFSKPVRQQVGYELDGAAWTGTERLEAHAHGWVGRLRGSHPRGRRTPSHLRRKVPACNLRTSRFPQEDAEDIKARYRNGEGPVCDCGSNKLE